MLRKLAILLIVVSVLPLTALAGRQEVVEKAVQVQDVLKEVLENEEFFGLGAEATFNYVMDKDYGIIYQLILSDIHSSFDDVYAIFMQNDSMSGVRGVELLCPITEDLRVNDHYIQDLNGLLLTFVLVGTAPDTSDEYLEILANAQECLTGYFASRDHSLEYTYSHEGSSFSISSQEMSEEQDLISMSMYFN